jgi:hypothetical protein
MADAAGNKLGYDGTNLYLVTSGGATSCQVARYGRL